MGDFDFDADIEAKHLIDGDHHSDSDFPCSVSSYNGQRYRRQIFLWISTNTYGFLIHLILVISYTIICLSVIWASKQGPTTSLHPIDDLDLKYKASTYSDFEKSPFAGPPSPSLDTHWHDLLASITLRVSKEELTRSNQASVAIPRGGYMAWLGVYHELHCIKMLRQWNYREHYHPNITEENIPHWDIHADHCLEVLRSAAICHADTTLTTFGWADQPQPMLNTKLIDHKCVDWEALMSSIRHRVVERDEVAALENPLL